MIQANDLRKYNWVNLDVVPYQITEIRDNCVSANYYPNKNVTLGTLYYVSENDIPYDLLFPIPLTENILLKCGFEERELFEDENPFFILDGVWLGTDSFAKNRFFYNSDIEIKSVHQLQNLYFALNNKELKIEL